MDEVIATTAHGARFPIAFLAILVVLWLAYQATRPAIDASQVMTIWLLTHASPLVGVAASSRGDLVAFDSGRFAYTVEEGCTGVAIVIVLSAAILAYPASKRARLIGVLVASPIILAVNLVRLVTMSWVGVHAPRVFDFLHYFAWQVMVILLAGLGFYVWTRLSRPGSEKLRTVIRESARALGALLAFFVPLWLLAAPVGTQAYEAVTNGLLGFFGSFSRTSSPVRIDPEYGAYLYILWAGFASLFLATPRLTWSKKGRGALFLLTPLLVVLQTLYLALFLAHRPPRLAHEVGVVLVNFGVPLAAWFLWARANWKAPGKYACPACAKRFDEIIDHVKQGHPVQRKRLLDQVRRDHPELSKERIDHA